MPRLVSDPVLFFVGTDIYLSHIAPRQVIEAIATREWVIPTQ